MYQNCCKNVVAQIYILIKRVTIRDCIVVIVVHGLNGYQKKN